jgi:hypothetical protein
MITFVSYPERVSGADSLVVAREASTALLLA